MIVVKWRNDGGDFSFYRRNDRGDLHRPIENTENVGATLAVAQGGRKTRPYGVAFR